LLANQREFWPGFFADGIGWGQAEFLEIFVLATLQDAEVEMGAGGESGAADEADRLADFDVLAWLHEHARQMQVHRFVAVGVGDLDHVAFAAFASSKFDASGADGLYRRPDRRAVVRAHVGAEQFQNRMVARLAEVRSDRGGEFQRRVEECALEGFSVDGVVAGMSQVIVKQQGLVFFVFVVVFGGEDFSVARGFAVGVFLFLEDHAKGVAFSRVGVEVEIVSKDLGKAHCEFGRFACLGDSFEKRIADLAGDGGDFDFGRNGFYFGGEFSFRSGDNLQHAIKIDAVVDLAEFAGRRAIDRHGVSGANLAEIEDSLGDGGDGARIGGVEASVLQRGGEVFVLADLGFDGWRVGGLHLLLLLRVLGFEGDFFLLDGFVNRVAVMEIAGDSADAEHQGCRDENEIVTIHPNSRAGAMIVRRNLAANVFARMKERFYRREFQKQRRKT